MHIGPCGHISYFMHSFGAAPGTHCIGSIAQGGILTLSIMQI
jgi:hypothetical protein